MSWEQLLPRWEIVPSEYENRKEFVITDEGGNVLWRASIRSDGCVDLRRVHNAGTPTEDEDYLHICDLKETVQMLQELEAVQLMLQLSGEVDG